MKLYNIFFVLFIPVIFFTCSSKKDLVYLQNDFDNIDVVSSFHHPIQIGDVLKITLRTESDNTLNIMVPPDLQSSVYNESRESLIFKGFEVDDEGYINYPGIGEINILGITTKEVEAKIASILSESEIMTDPVIDVKIINLHFTILGEVNMPGKYYYDKQNLNLFEAIGMAGDLTINGVRKDIKLLRFENDKVSSVSIDLTNKSVVNDNYFQISSGDIIIINPNYSRVKNAGIIGNSGTLLSLLSFLLSSIIVIQR